MSFPVKFLNVAVKKCCGKCCGECMAVLALRCILPLGLVTPACLCLSHNHTFLLAACAYNVIWVFVYVSYVRVVWMCVSESTYDMSLCVCIMCIQCHMIHKDNVIWYTKTHIWYESLCMYRMCELSECVWVRDIMCVHVHAHIGISDYITLVPHIHA